MKKLLIVSCVIWIIHIVALYSLSYGPGVQEEINKLKDRQDWLVHVVEKLIQQKDGKS